MKALAIVDKFIIATFLMVVLLAYPTFQSIVKSDVLDNLKEVTPQTSVQARRSIASVNPEAGIKSHSVKFENTLDLYCGKKLAQVQLEVRNEYIQLDGKNCWNGTTAKAVEIINTTNGFSATVFQQNRDKYKTDLIQLKHGKNEIKIRYHSANGDVLEQQLLVHSI